MHFLASRAFAHNKSYDSYTKRLLGTSKPKHHATTQQVHDTVRTLVEKGDSDPMSFGRALEWGHLPVLDYWSGPSETFAWLLNQDHFQVDLQSWREREGRSIYHSLARGLTSSVSTVLLDVLWKPLHIAEMKRVRDKSGYTVLHRVLKSLCGMTVTGFQGSEVSTSGWELVRRLIEEGADVHILSISGNSPLDSILSAERYCWLEHDRCAREGLDVGDEKSNEERRQAFIKWWLVTLKGAGYDLKAYGRKEQAVHPHNDREVIYHFRDRAAGHIRSIIRTFFTYGEGENELDVTWKEISRTDISWEAQHPIPGGWTDSS